MAALRASVELGATKDAALPPNRSGRKGRERALSAPPQPSAPSQPDVQPVNNGLIDKSALMLNEPRRYRDRAHLEFVSSQPCLLC
jgi:hypothetical protein